VRSAAVVVIDAGLDRALETKELRIAERVGFFPANPLPSTTYARFQSLKPLEPLKP
jgi:hypothetical protein